MQPKLHLMHKDVTEEETEQRLKPTPINFTKYKVLSSLSILPNVVSIFKKNILI